MGDIRNIVRKLKRDQAYRAFMPGTSARRQLASLLVVSTMGHVLGVSPSLCCVAGHRSAVQYPCLLRRRLRDGRRRVLFGRQAGRGAALVRSVAMRSGPGL